MEDLFNILELAMIFVTFPFFLRMFNAVDYSRIFKKGYTSYIQIIYVAFVFTFSYLFSHSFVGFLKLFINIFY